MQVTLGFRKTQAWVFWVQVESAPLLKQRRVRGYCGNTLVQFNPGSRGRHLIPRCCQTASNVQPTPDSPTTAHTKQCFSLALCLSPSTVQLSFLCLSDSNSCLVTCTVYRHKNTDIAGICARHYTVDPLCLFMRFKPYPADSSGLLPLFFPSSSVCLTSANPTFPTLLRWLANKKLQHKKTYIKKDAAEPLFTRLTVQWSASHFATETWSPDRPDKPIWARRWFLLWRCLSAECVHAFHLCLQFILIQFSHLVPFHQLIYGHVWQTWDLGLSVYVRDRQRKLVGDDLFVYVCEVSGYAVTAPTDSISEGIHCASSAALWALVNTKLSEDIYSNLSPVTEVLSTSAADEEAFPILKKKGVGGQHLVLSQQRYKSRLCDKRFLTCASAK